MAVFGRGDTFRDVRSWYSRLALLEQQICLLERSNGQPLGTGFLVGPDLVLTADHVVVPTHGAKQPFPDVVARFDFARSQLTAEVTPGTTYPMAPGSWLLANSPPFATPETNAVDTALLRLASPVGQLATTTGDPRGWVELIDGVHDALPNSSLAIMQHPEGGPLKLSLNTQAVIGIDDTTGRLTYRTDTMPGSSGAPCFDLDWKFVAMHEGRDFHGGNHNRGIPLSMIQRWLQQEGYWDLVTQRSPVALRSVALERQAASVPETSFAMPPDLRALVAGGEGQLVEFKQGIAVNAQAGDKRAGTKKVVTAVAAFMNSREGGNVVIGIDDTGQFVGVEHEYTAIDQQSANWDGYYRFLTSVLNSRLDVDSAFSFFTVARYQERGKEICVIHVEAADRPVFVDDVFYVRVGALSQPLKGRELLTFAAGRWAILGERTTTTSAPSVRVRDRNTGRGQSQDPIPLESTRDESQS